MRDELPSATSPQHAMNATRKKVIAPLKNTAFVVLERKLNNLFGMRQ